MRNTETQKQNKTLATIQTTTNQPKQTRDSPTKTNKQANKQTNKQTQNRQTIKKQKTMKHRKHINKQAKKQMT